MEDNFLPIPEMNVHHAFGRKYNLTLKQHSKTRVRLLRSHLLRSDAYYKAFGNSRQTFLYKFYAYAFSEVAYNEITLITK